MPMGVGSKCGTWIFCQILTLLLPGASLFHKHMSSLHFNFVYHTNKTLYNKRLQQARIWHLCLEQVMYTKVTPSNVLIQSTIFQSYMRHVGAMLSVFSSVLLSKVNVTLALTFGRLKYGFILHKYIPYGKTFLYIQKCLIL